MKVFRPKTPPEAIELASRLLEYNPTARFTPLEACAHKFFDELRDPGVRLPSGKDLPLLFNFSQQGTFIYSLLTFTFTYSILSLYLLLDASYIQVYSSFPLASSLFCELV